MKSLTTTTRVRSLWSLGVAAAAAMAFGPGLALADYTVNSGEPIVVSDDVLDRTTDVVSLTGGPSGSGGSGNSTKSSKSTKSGNSTKSSKSTKSGNSTKSSKSTKSNSSKSTKSNSSKSTKSNK